MSGGEGVAGRTNLTTALNTTSAFVYADYDLTERFRRSEVQTLIRNARQGISALTQLPSSNEKKFFLACLWAWKELTNR